MTAFEILYIPLSYLETTTHSPGSIAHAPTAKTSSQTVCYKPEKQNRIASTPRLSKQQRTTKTPAGVKSSTAELLDGTVPAPLKTPCFEASQAPKRASPAQSGFLSTHSAFKTPSPNLLLRRRKGGGSPVPLHFPNPTSLKSDDITEDLLDSKPPRLTLLEELDAQHSLIDNMSEVDYATRQAADQTGIEAFVPVENVSQRTEAD